MDPGGAVARRAILAANTSAVSSVGAGTRFAVRVSRLGTEEAFKLGSLIREVEREGPRVIRCNLGQPDFPLPDHVRKAVSDALDAGLTGYCDPQGIPELREAIARDVGERRGLDVDPERVVVYPGGRVSIGFAQHAYCDPGQEVVFPTPGYPLFESFVEWVEGIPRVLRLREEDGFVVCPEELESLLSEKTALVFLNFPANPTGGVATPEELEAIAEVVLRSAAPHARVYSDESYEAIVFDGRKHHSIASVPGMEERTVIASAVSKTYAWTGGRVGWAVYPTVEEARVHRNLNINFVASIPPYNQVGARVAIESPESRPAVARMVRAFQERRDFMVARLSAMDGVSCRVPGGAFYVFPNVAGVLDRLGAVEAYGALAPDLRLRTSPATLFQLFLLFRYRVATMDRRSFGIRGSDGQHFLRISVATGMDELREAADRIEEAGRDVAGFESFIRERRRLTL